MELRQLQYFREVCYEKSFTKAASNLFVSQPVITNSIHKLEEELEVRLLDRDTKRVTLTLEGECMLKKVEQLLGTVDEVYREIADLKQSRHGLVRLGIPVQIGNYLFPRILSEFRTENPNVNLQAMEIVSGEVIDLLEKEELDVGIIVLPSQPIPNMQMQFLFEEDVLLCVSEENPLRKKEKVSFGDLKDEHFIMRMPGSIQRDMIITECQKYGFLPKIVFSSSQVQTIKSLVFQNIGISFLMSISLFDSPTPYVVPLEKPLHLPIGLVWKNGRYISKATQDFIDYMLLSFKK
jgi:Transcriptional regulator